ncbi:MAG TPA: ferric reductase-like transmembrane domain-containing protein [Acidimicrobiia bacterium]|nr:ferric reductase-like transmembrane domain-containing protein [Acidimicrobiia bacterium]
MTSQVWWYAARSSGIVSWATLCLSVVWGLMLSTRTMKQTISRPWLLGVHRAFSGFSVIFMIVHVAALIFDSYTHFDIIDALVPFASTWHPLAVAWGVVGLWIMIAVELTSLTRKHIPNEWWKRVHFASFALFVVATIHGLTSGTDTGTMLGVLIAACVAVPITLLSIFRIYKWVNAPMEIPVNQS